MNKCIFLNAFLLISKTVNIDINSPHDQKLFRALGNFEQCKGVKGSKI